jgi:uncharacterized protein
MKYKSVQIIITVAFFLITIASCKAQTSNTLITNKDNNTLLWEITGNGLQQPTYVYGTYHIMCKKYVVVSNQLNAAIANVDEVYMELDMDDPATMMGAFSLMNMKADKKLFDLYTPIDYKKVSSFFIDSMHIPLSMVNKMKPFFLMAMLYPKMTECNASSGVEEAILKVAKANKKEIKGLETMAFQAGVFDSIPYTTQAKELLKMIDSLPQYKKYMDTLLTIYLSQNLQKIEDQFNNKEMGLMDNQDILLDDRNANWVMQLQQLMKQKSLLVAVGAGHLVGKKGLIQLLKNQGYVVRPLLNK